MKMKKVLYVIFAAALIVSSVAGCKRNEPLTTEETTAAVKAALPPQPAPAPTAEQNATAVINKMPDELTKDDVQTVLEDALKKHCNCGHSAKKNAPAQLAVAPPPAPPSPQPVAAPAAAPQPALPPAPVAQVAAMPQPAPPPPVSMTVAFPESIRMESALTDVPPCNPSTNDDGDRKKGKNKTAKPCPGSLAERQTIAQEGINNKLGKVITPLRIIAVASVGTAIATGVVAGTDVHTAINGGVKITNIISCSAIGNCSIATNAAKTFTGANGTIFKIATVTPTK